MKRYITKLSTYCLLAFLIATAASCSKEYQNPGGATDTEVAGSSQGLTGVAVGLQRIYTAGRGSSLYNRITADGFLTNQLIILNQGNTAEYQLFLGAGSLDGTNTIVGGLWTSSNKILYEADNVIRNAELLADKNYASGLTAYATIFKALALGDLSMFWQNVPAGTGQRVTFVDRMEGFKMAITAIDKSLALIAASPVSPSFFTNIPTGIDIINTLHALKARYSLYTGNYAQAQSSANMVDLSRRSVFTFNTVNLNPIFETATSTNNVYTVLDSTMGLPVALHPNPNDKRVPFYLTVNAGAAPRFRISGFGGTSTVSIPVYLPGGITLIKAEAYTRQNDLVNGLIELNKVVTKRPANDPFGVGADLPPLAALSQAQLLEQIYRHRAIELYMSGLRLEDMRRFGRPTTERKRNFLPYPFQERDNNTNTPADPAF